MVGAWYIVPFLLLFAVIAVVIAIFLLAKGIRGKSVLIDDSLSRDREQLERLEAIDRRLERLEKTLHELPS